MQPTAIFALGSALALLGSALLSAQGFPPGPPMPPQPAPPPRPTGPIEVNGIAAKVNGHVITKNEVNFQVAPISAQLASQFPRRGPEFERQLKAARDGIIQELIDRQIILDEYKEIGANINDFLIDEEIKHQIRELFNGDEKKFQEELRRSRMTMDGYRRTTKEKVIVQAMRRQQFADAPPPLPSEVREEYSLIKNELRDTSKDKISFKKIFIPRIDRESLGSTPEGQLALAEDLVRQLKAGGDFAKLADVHSADAYAAEGGVQKDVPRTDLSPEFAAIIFAAKPGVLLGPLEDVTGYTIVIPTKIDYGPAPALDGKVRQMVEERVRRKKTSARYERWIEARRKKAMYEVLE